MAVINDGFQTLISFSANPTIKFYEKEVTPPSLTGGGANDTTTMRNTTYRTKAPKKLKSLGEVSATCAYDPNVYPQIVAMANVNQLITITFPDNSTLAFWGWLDEFVPGSSKEGEQPTASVKVICSNQNASLVETAPVFTAGS